MSMLLYCMWRKQCSDANLREQPKNTQHEASDTEELSLGLCFIVYTVSRRVGYKLIHEQPDSNSFLYINVNIICSMNNM